MKRLFVDTSAWAALASRRDSNHQSALQVRNQIVGQYVLVTSNYVLDELYTLLLMNIGYLACVKFKQQLDALQTKELLTIEWITEERSTASWQTFERFNSDKEWSFTDCTSYALMKELEMTEVFTFDHHFSQMGFVCHR